MMHLFRTCLLGIAGGIGGCFSLWAQCDVSHLQAGMYLVTFASADGEAWGTQQLVVR